MQTRPIISPGTMHQTYPTPISPRRRLWELPYLPLKASRTCNTTAVAGVTGLAAGADASGLASPAPGRREGEEDAGVFELENGPEARFVAGTSARGRSRSESADCPAERGEHRHPAVEAAGLRSGSIAAAAALQLAKVLQVKPPRLVELLSPITPRT